MTDEILDLQATAGNRSVAAAIGETPVQRAPAPAPANDGGVITFDSGAVIRIQSATWSLKRGVQSIRHGASRRVELEPTKLTVGDLVLTRARDAQSDGLAAEVRTRLTSGAPVTDEHATLKLNQPSADGGLPAVTFDLWEVGIQQIAEGKGDDPTERLTLYAGRMQMAGATREKESRSTPAAVAQLELDGRKATPVFHFEIDGGRASVTRNSPETLRPARHGPVEPIRVRVVIPAGATFTRLAATLEEQTRSNATLTVTNGNVRFEFRDILVSEINSSTEGPGIASVGFYAETYDERRPG